MGAKFRGFGAPWFRLPGIAFRHQRVGSEFGGARVRS